MRLAQVGTWQWRRILVIGNIDVNPNNNNYGNNFNKNPTNTGSYQNRPTNDSNPNGGTERSPFEQPPPLVYSIPGQSDSDSDDSTEIVFTNPYLIVGVESLLLYGEFHDSEDIKIIIQQDSDGLEPYPWNQWTPIDEPNATSANQTAPVQNQSPSNNEITTTTIKNTVNTETVSTTSTSNVDTTTSVPLASM